ncbi:MAG: methylmalonyl-CoA epimerase [Bacteroidota bacterium]
MDKIEHLGIAVHDLEISNKLFEKLLGTSPFKTEEVVSEKVKTSFFKLGPNKIELLQATATDSVIAKYLKNNGEGVHHVAFATNNLEADLNRLGEQGFKVLEGFPKKGADNKNVAFLHPRETNGILVELCEDIKGTNKREDNC